MNNDLTSFPTNSLERQFDEAMRPLVDAEESGESGFYSVKTFIHYFRLGVSHHRPRVNKIGRKHKFKLVMYFLASFVDLDEAFAKFSNFKSFAELSNEVKSERPFLISIYEKSQYQNQLEELFYSRTTNEPSKLMEQLNFTKFYKKLLIVLESLLDLMKIHINEKCQSTIFPEKEYYEKYKLVISNAFPEKRIRGLLVDSSVVTKSLGDLLDGIDLEEVVTLLAFNNALVKKKGEHEVFFRNPKGALLSLGIGLDDQSRFYSHKYKRPFLCRKYLFKFIKNQIFTKFKKHSMHANPRFSPKDIKARFKSLFIKSKTCEKLFETEKINKKNFKLLGKLKDPVVSEIAKFLASDLVRDLVGKWAEEPAPAMFNKFLTFTTFGHFFLHHTKKRPLLFKECLK